MQDNSSSPAADDFVPAPGGGNASAQPTPTATVGVADDHGALVPIKVDAGIGQTAIILSLVVFLVLAAVLLFVRSAIRRSLIASRAPLEAAGAAAWAWYATLLAFGALLIGGIVGHLFALTSYVLLTLAIGIVGAAVSAMLTSRARRAA